MAGSGYTAGGKSVVLDVLTVLSAGEVHVTCAPILFGVLGVPAASGIVFYDDTGDPDTSRLLGADEFASAFVDGAEFNYYPFGGVVFSLAVDADAAVDAPVTTPTMEPPAGAVPERDLTRASAWTSENGGFLTEPGGQFGPDGDIVLRSTLVDGQTGASSGGPVNLSERNDMRAGDVPLGSVRWVTWHERFVQMPTTDLDSWQLIAPCEIHGNTLTQATLMMQVSASKHRILNANAGRPEWRWVDLGPIVLGEWHQYKLGLKYVDDDSGWLELWRDGELMASYPGEPTTTEHLAGYWKFGHYRNQDIDGTSIYEVSGVRRYRVGGL